MADLAAVNVTVNLVPQDQEFMGKKRVSFPVIAFGNGVLTYPANGVPLPAMGAFGMKKEIKRVFIEGQPGDGFIYKYDRAHHTIRIYQSAALVTHTHDLKYIGGIAETEAVMIAGGDTLGKNAATDRTIAGADSATKGGVVAGGAVAAGALAELGNVVVAAKTLYLMVVGQ